MKKILAREKGQGLVEYALIIVLVAIVVIVALQLLGPIIGNVFSEIAGDLEGPGVVTDVTAIDSLGTLTVTVYVSTPTNVSLSGDVSHPGQMCAGSCTFSFGAYPPSGSVTATADAGGHKTATW